MTELTIVDTTHRDAHSVAALIATAFDTLDVAGWLVRDPTERTRVLYAHVRIFVEHAFDYGTVQRTNDGTAVAVWLRRDRPLPDIADYPRRRWLACGRYNLRFLSLDAAFDYHHPDQPHHHLAFLAVDPQQQGTRPRHRTPGPLPRPPRPGRHARLPGSIQPPQPRLVPPPRLPRPRQPHRATRRRATSLAHVEATAVGGQVVMHADSDTPRPALAHPRQGRLANRLRLMLARYQIWIAMLGGAVFAAACIAYLFSAVGVR